MQINDQSTWENDYAEHEMPKIESRLFEKWSSEEAAIMYTNPHKILTQSMHPSLLLLRRRSCHMSTFLSLSSDLLLLLLLKLGSLVLILSLRVPLTSL